MFNKGRALALGLVTLFSFGIAPASMASPFEETKPSLFTFSVGEFELATIDSEQTAAGKDTLTFNGLTLTCSSVTAQGNPIITSGVEPHAVNGSTFGRESTDITLIPTYSGCHVIVAGLTKFATVTTNLCSYIYDAKTTVTDIGFDHTAAMSIECPSKKKIEIHVYNEKETEGTTLCTYDISPQATLSGVTLSNKTNTPFSANDIAASLNVTLAIVNTKLSALCGASEAATAVYKGEDTIRATGKAEFVDASVSD